MSEYVPMPLERHPWYAGRNWIVDWVEHRGPHAHLHTIRVPVPRPMRISFADEDLLSCPLVNEVVLTRRRCAAWAPWTGWPYHYEWHVGTDQYGRHVAGDARIVWEA